MLVSREPHTWWFGASGKVRVSLKCLQYCMLGTVGGLSVEASWPGG